MDTFTGVVTTGIYCRPGCSGIAAGAQHQALHVGRRGRGRGLPPVPALPSRPRARARVGRGARARLPGPARDRRRRARRRHRGRARGAARGQRAPPPPPVRRARRRDPGRGRTQPARALRPAAARRHRPPARARRRRGRVQQRPPVQPGHEGRLPVHAPGAARPPARPRPARHRRRARAADAVPRRRWHGQSMLAFLAPRAIPGVETVDLDAGVYRRVVELARRARRHRGVGRTRPRRRCASASTSRRSTASCTCSRACAGSSTSTPIPTVIDTALARDRTLRPLVRARRGVRVPGAIDPFEVSVRAVLGQQVSVAGATTLAGRLVERFGTPVPGIARARPDPPLPRPPSSGRRRPDRGRPHPGPRPGRQRAGPRRSPRATSSSTGPATSTTPSPSCSRCPGFGPWTAHYVAMRACGERDAFPASDLGLRRVAGRRSRRPGRGVAPVAGLRRDPGLARPGRRVDGRDDWVERVERCHAGYTRIGAPSRVFPGQT